MIYLYLIFKTILLFLFLLISMRVMGKREVGELSIFDIGIFFVISEFLTISISNDDKSLLHSLTSVATLVILQLFLAKVSLKSNFLRKLIDGTPSIIINNGKVDYLMMKKNRYSLDDLLAQMQQQGYFSFENIKYAILLTSGKLVILDQSSDINYPFPLISDGKVDYKVLKDLNINYDKFLKRLKMQGVKKIEDVFICLLKREGLYILLKGDSNSYC